MKDVKTMVYDIERENIRKKEGLVRQFFSERDVISWQNDKLELELDYEINGDQRFARIYAALDPGREHTDSLTRRKVIFKHDNQN
jgi:hypothetical protein